MNNPDNPGNATGGTTVTYDGFTPLHPTIPHVIIYTQPGCTSCRALARLLDRKDVPALLIDVTANDAAKAALTEIKVSSTPVTVAHNIYDKPVYFSGLAPDQASALAEKYHDIVDGHIIAGKVFREAMAMLHESTEELADWSRLAHELVPVRGDGSGGGGDKAPRRRTPWKLGTDGSADE